MHSVIPVSQSVLSEVTIVGSITPEQLPIFVGSGPLHNVGAVPDPGAVAGSDRFLCEDGTFAVPPGVEGTVSSVGLALPSIFTLVGSPVTGNGTLSATFATQVANTLFSGPSTGSPAFPTFRSLAAADIPSLDFSKITTGTAPVSAGGTGATTAATARTNLSAAALGANADITSLTATTSVASPSSLNFSAAAGNSISIAPGTSGIIHALGASNVTNVMRLRAGVATNNTTSLLFYGASAAADLWSIGNAISTLDTTRKFEIYDVPNALTRLSVSNSGTVAIPTGDLQVSATTDSQTRVITNRSYNYSLSNIETKLTYTGVGTAGTLFGTIPNASLGALAFQGTSNAVLYTSTASPLIFGTALSERMRITGTGNVGIAHLFPSEKLEVSGNVKATAFIGDAAQLTGLTASQIPNLDASKITSGTLGTSQVPSMDAAKITTGTFAAARIPSLDASIITSGSLSIARGGTNAATAITALNNLLPTQTSNAGKTLTTDGFNASWGSASGTVTSFSAGTLSPLFSTTVTTASTTPSLTFILTATGGPAWFGNNSSFTAPPSFHTDPLPASLLPLNVGNNVAALAMTSSTTVNWDNARVFTGALVNNVTFLFVNAAAGQTIKIRITQGASSYTLTWPAAVRWQGGVEPTMTTVNGKMDFYTITYDGVNYLGEYVQALA